MNIHEVEYDISDSYLDELDSFGEWDVEAIEKLGVEWCCYWYAIGDYCGGGYILMRKDRRWYVHNCNHCSCYGPTEDIELREGFHTIEGMIKDGSEDFNNEMSVLFEFVKKNEEWV